MAWKESSDTRPGGKSTMRVLPKSNNSWLYGSWVFIRWLFYIEGALTIFFAICAIFILPDFPATSHTWLSPIEVQLAEKRMEEDVGVGDEGQTEAGGQFGGLTMALTDWKVWWLALALTSMVISLSFNAFFPTLSATMGFSTTITLLLCAPPWAFATLVAFAMTRYIL